MFARTIFILTLLIGLCAAVHAQGVALPDSLRNALERAGSNRERAELLYQWGDRYVAEDTTAAVRYVREGLRLVPDNRLYQGIGYYYLGRVYMDFSPPKAEAAFDTALRYLNEVDTHESEVYQSRTWGNRALLAQLAGDDRKNIDLLLNYALPLAAQAGDSLRMAEIYSNVALPFMNFGEYDKALLYLGRAENIFVRHAPRDQRLVDVYSHEAKIYMSTDSLDAAGGRLQLAADRLATDPESVFAPNFHALEGMYFIRRKRWAEAERTIEKGLVLAERQNSRYDIRQLLYQKSSLYGAQNRYAEARDVLLDLYDKGYVTLLNDQKQLFSDLAALEKELGNHQQAYAWIVKHEEIMEQLYREETTTKIADLEARYNYVQKESELLIAREKARRQQTIVWMTVVAFVLTLAGILLWLRYRRLRMAREIQNLKQQQRIDLGRALLEGEEKERSRLARDLHDGLGGMLAAIKLNLSQLMDTNERLGRQELGQTIDRLGQSVTELRRISRNMMPESLLQLGLETALRDLCGEAALPGLKISFRAFDVHADFSSQVQVMIYRIVQELIYNALKHAAATRMMVQCSQSENVFFITVEDNGKGFSPAEVPTTSRGLQNIRNRVDLLKGKMDIESSPEGTNINIELYVGQQ